MQPAVPEGVQYIEMSQARAEQVSGANEASSMGVAGSSGHSNMARSSAGAQLLAAGGSNRISDHINKLASQVIVPVLYEIYEMNREMLPPSQLNFILSKELQDAYITGGGDIADLLNARVKFSISAGSDLAKKRQIAQGLPIISQFITQPMVGEQLAIQHKKLDIQELLRLQFWALGLTDYNDMVVDMTPQDIQQLQQQQNGAAQAKLQGQSQLQEQKFEQQQQLQDQGDVAKAARDVLREQYKASVEGKADPTGGGAFSG
jgi:hypothetical protein